MIGSLLTWGLSFIGPNVLKKGITVIVVLLVGTTAAAAYVAKNQYDQKVAAKQSIVWLQSAYESMRINAESNAVLLKLRDKKIRLLTVELRKIEEDVRYVPDDGCLDKRLPDDVTRLLQR